MTPPPVRMTVQWVVRPQQGRGMLSALQSLMTRTRREPGCMSCSLETEVGERVTVKLREQWEAEENLKCYVRSAEFEKLAMLIESASEPPMIRFELDAATRGFDWAQEVRRQGDGLDTLPNAARSRA